MCTHSFIHTLCLSFLPSIDYATFYLRQEKLEQLAEKFGRKASLRESWLSDMNHVLDELDKGHDVHAVDAALKRHEAISADIQAGVSPLVLSKYITTGVDYLL